MPDKWEMSLIGLLDGKQLSTDEINTLSATVCDAVNKKEIQRWLILQDVLSQHLGEISPEELSRSRDRLFARTTLHAKRLSNKRRHQRRMLRRCVFAAAAAITLAVALFARFHTSYPAPMITGAYQVADAGPLTPGARIATTTETASLKLGGYCHILLLPNSEITLSGAPYREGITLHRGAVECQVDRQQGTFLLQTTVGNVQVEGTRFEVRLLEAEVSDPTLYVAVSSGAVLVFGKWGETRLHAGESLHTEFLTAISEVPDAMPEIQALESPESAFQQAARELREAEQKIALDDPLHAGYLRVLEAIDKQEAPLRELWGRLPEEVLQDEIIGMREESLAVRDQILLKLRQTLAENPEEYSESAATRSELFHENLVRATEQQLHILERIRQQAAPEIALEVAEAIQQLQQTHTSVIEQSGLKPSRPAPPPPPAIPQPPKQPRPPLAPRPPGGVGR